MSHSHEDTIERTLVLLKPDALDRGLVGEILQRFERVGLKLAGIKMLQATEDHARQHYTEDVSNRLGEHIRTSMIEMLKSGPIIAVVLEGVEAVESTRKLIGATEPKSAIPGTIRGDYAHASFKHADLNKVGMYNLIHGSSSVEEANVEIAVWFTEDELIDHDPGYTRHTIRFH